MIKVSTHLKHAIDGFTGLWFKALPVMLVTLVIYIIESLGVHFGSRWVDCFIYGICMLVSLYFIMIIVNMALAQKSGGISLRQSLSVGLKTFFYAFVTLVVYYVVISALVYCVNEVMGMQAVSTYFSWALAFLTGVIIAFMLVHYPLFLAHIQSERSSLIPALQTSWKMFYKRWEEVCLRVALYVLLAVIFTAGVSVVLGIIASLINLLMGNSAIALADNIVSSVYFVFLLIPFTVVFYTQLYLDLKEKPMPKPHAD
jgi:hypothetical protein